MPDPQASPPGEWPKIFLWSNRARLLKRNYSILMLLAVVSLGYRSYQESSVLFLMLAAAAALAALAVQFQHRGPAVELWPDYATVYVPSWIGARPAKIRYDRVLELKRNVAGGLTILYGSTGETEKVPVPLPYIAGAEALESFLSAKLGLPIQESKSKWMRAVWRIVSRSPVDQPGYFREHFLVLPLYLVCAGLVSFLMFLAWFYLAERFGLPTPQWLLMTLLLAPPVFGVWRFYRRRNKEQEDGN